MVRESCIETMNALVAPLHAALTAVAAPLAMRAVFHHHGSWKVGVRIENS